MMSYKETIEQSPLETMVDRRAYLVKMAHFTNRRIEEADLNIAQLREELDQIRKSIQSCDAVILELGDKA